MELSSGICKGSTSALPCNLSKAACPLLMLWTALHPACGRKRRLSREESNNEQGGDRWAGHLEDGLFAEGKFCLIRRGGLVLPQPRGWTVGNRALPEPVGAVPRGSRPFEAGHEAAAVDGPPADGGPCGGAAALGQGLSAASADGRRTSRHACSPGCSVGRLGGEPSCK